MNSILRDSVYKMLRYVFVNFADLWLKVSKTFRNFDSAKRCTSLTKTHPVNLTSKATIIPSEH